MFVSPLMLMLIEIGHTKEEEDHYFLTLSLGGQEVGRNDTTGSCCGVRETVIHIYIHDESIETSDEITSANLEA